jgi:hypothetical protein
MRDLIAINRSNDEVFHKIGFPPVTATVAPDT